MKCSGFGAGLDHTLHQTPSASECFGALGGTSAPMRVDGDEVQVPGDGDLYSDDVRRLFPAEIADAILTDQERLKP